MTCVVGAEEKASGAGVGEATSSGLDAGDSVNESTLGPGVWDSGEGHSGHRTLD